MDQIKIKKLSLEDVDDVFQIEKTFFDVTEKQSIISSLEKENLNYFVLYFKEIIVGFLECSIVLDEAELYEIAVKKEFQGKGFSNYLMEYLLYFCDSKNVRTIFLEVNTMNSKAINLYKKFGFVEYSIRKKYYGDNDAILMKCER